MKKNSKQKEKNKAFEDLSLAEMLSAVLYHPELPEPMADGIQDAITNTFNEAIDQSEIVELEKQPHYLNMVIRGYHVRKANPRESDVDYQEVVQ